MGVWIARDADDSLWVYKDKPDKGLFAFTLPKYGSDEHFQIDAYLYPEVTWNNSPQELITKELQEEE
jgi:hypothetical protein